MKKVLLRTLGSLTMLVILVSAFAINANTFFPRLNDVEKPAADATFRKAAPLAAVGRQIKAFVEPATPLLGPVFTSCPSDMVVSNDPGLCGKVVTFSPVASEPSRDTSVTFQYSGGTYDYFTVPNGVTSIKIRAVGAAGGSKLVGATVVGGRGASMSGTFAVVPGQKLYYLIGQKGGNVSNTALGAGGGGGTFVTAEPTFSVLADLKLAAAGGGGAANSLANVTTNPVTQMDGNITLAGSNGTKPNPAANYSPGDGGGATNPLAAAAGVGGANGNLGGAGGAGWTENGQDAIVPGPTTISGSGGVRPTNALADNASGVPAVVSNGTLNNGAGGYGGGGAGNNGGGGGGGFNGGGGGARNSSSPTSTQGSYGGGGGSYNSGTAQENKKGSDISGNDGKDNGFVTFSWTINPVVTVKQIAGLPSGSLFPVGTTTNVFEAEDELGIKAYCTFTVTVNDIEKPTITAPANKTVFVDANSCVATNVSLGSPVIADNCPNPTVANDAPASFPKGTTTVTWTVTDAHGNQETATQTVTVIDNIPPVIVCPSNVVVTLAEGETTATVTYPAATATDNCGTPTVTYSIPSGSVFNPGTTHVTATATDAGGLTATCSFDVIVVSGSSPKITITGNSILIPNGNATYTTADNTDMGTTVTGSPISKQFYINSTGTAPLVVTSILGTGPDGARFQINGAPTLPVTIPAGSSEPFNVVFDASVPGTFYLTITVASNDATNAAYVYHVKAQATAPPLEPGSIGYPQIICKGNSAASLESVTDASGGYGAITYQWQSSADGVNFTDIPGATAAGYSPGALNVTTFFRRVANTTSGTAVSDAVRITVNETAVPTITASGSTTFCEGGSVTLTSSPADSYNWSTGATTQSIVVTQSGTYGLEVTTNGCSANSLGTTVTVNALPSAPTVTVVNNCNNTSTLTASNYTGTLLWSNGQSTPSITVSSSGTYTVAQTVDGCTGAQASGIANPKTTPATLAYTTLQNCDGTVTITATNATGSILWTPGGQTTASINVNAAGTYGAQQTVNGCSSVASSVNVTPVVPPAVFAVSGNTTICSNNTSQVVSVSLSGSEVGVVYTLVRYGNPTAMTINGTGSAISFSFPYSTFNGGYFNIRASKAGLPVGCYVGMSGNATHDTRPAPAAPTVSVVDNCNGTSTLTASNYSGALAWSTGATTSSITVSTAGTYTVTQSVESCMSAAGSGVASPKTAPVAPVVSVVNNCNGTSTLTASGYTGTLAWSTGASSSTITVSSAGTYTVTQTVNGCTSAAGSGLAAPKSVPSTPSITVVDNCNGTSTLSTTAEGSLIWSTGETTPVITVSTAGTYSLSQTVEGCVSGTGYATASPKTAPSTPVVSANGNTTVCPGQSVSLTASSGVNYSYQWYKDGVAVTGATSVNYEATASGSYTVIVTVAGCTSAASNAVVVTIADVTAPATPTLPAITAECSATATAPTTTDACAGTIVGTTTDPLTYNTQGDHIIHWTFTDPSGNSTTADQHVIIHDVTPPVPVCPAPISVNASTTDINGNGGANVNFAATATDNCSTPSIAYSKAPGSFFPIGTTTVTVTATDAVGNAATCSFDVTVTCATPTPVISRNGPATFCSGGSVVLTSSASTGNVWSTGETTQSITVSASGTYTVTVTENGCPKTSVGTVVTVNNPPTVTITNNSPSVCEGNTTLLYTNVNAMTGVWSSSNTAVASTEPAFTTGFAVAHGISAGTAVITYTYTDGNGCSASGSTTITVNPRPDATVTVSGPTNICRGGSVVLHAAEGTGYTYQWYASGNPISGATGAEYTATTSGDFSVTVRNANGCQTNSAVTHVTVTDYPVTIPVAAGPTEVCPGRIVILQVANSASGETYQWVKNLDPIAGATASVYTATESGSYGLITTSSAGCVYPSSVQINVAIEDVTPPVMPTLPNITAECSATATAPTTTDACAGTIVGSTTDALTYNTQGDHVIHWTFTDPSGNTTTAEQHVIISDVTAPVVACPSNITRSATTTISGYGAIVTYTATATDNCGTPAVTYSPVSGSFFPVGTTTVTVTADDGHGHTTSCHFDVTVIAPEINITGNNQTIVDGDATPSTSDHTNFGSTTLGTPIVKTFTIQNTGNDNLDVSAINISGADAGNFSVSGFTPTVLAPGASATFDVTFLSNTVGTKTATVTVSNNDNDESAYDFAVSAEINCSTPVFSACPSNKTVNTDAGLCSAVVNYTTTVSGVPTPSLTYTFSGATSGSGSGNGSGSVFNKGTTTVTITAANACGDVVCSFTVTVEDHENPVIANVPASISKSNDAGVCGAVVTWTLPTATDNCPIVTLVSDKHSGDVFPIGTTTVHYTATDASGNTSSASFTVTVEDTEDPTITMPADVTHTADAGLCSYKFANSIADINTVTPDGHTPGYGPTAILLGTATGSDNCGAPTVAGVRSDGLSLTDPYPVGVTTITWTVTDSHGRTTTGVQTITITDDEFPVIHNMPAAISTPADANTCGAVVTWNAPTATDNCAVTMVSNHQPGETFPIGTTTVVYTATDVHGHVTTGQFAITVTDNQKPSIACPGDITVAAQAGKNGANVTYVVTAADNCGTATLSYTIASGSLFAIGTTPVTATATDAAGNEISCTFNVIVTNNPPVANPDVNTTTEDVPVSGNVLPNDSDADGHTLAVTTFTINSTSYTAGQTASFAEGTIVLNADGSYTYTPAANFNGAVPVVTYYITDGHGGTAHTTLTINVTPVNDGPVANPDSNTTLEDTPVSGNVLPNDSDIDGDNLVVTGFVINGTPYAPGTIALLTGIGDIVLNADGSYTYVPAPNYNGPVPVVTYTITDGHGGTASSTLTINVTPVDDEPVAVNDTESVNEDGVLSSTVTGNDTPSGDGGNVWSVVTTTTHGTLVFNTDGTYTYTPNANFNGTDVFTYKVCDADGDCSTATVTITVVSVNDQPVAVNDVEIVNEDEVLTSTVRTNDTESGDGGNVWSVVTNPSHGTLVFNTDGTYTYTPNANYNGPDAFTYKVCDADGDCSTAVVNITVVPVNDVPLAVDDAVSTNEDEAIHATVTGNDTPSPDGGNVWSVVTNPAHGTLVFNSDGSYIYTPNANYHGTDAFTYKVCDANGDCATATVNITVISVNDPAVIKVKNITVYVDANGHVSIAAGQIDDGSYDPDGIASITLNKTDFNCSDIATSPNTVTLTVTDVEGNSMSADATVTVLDAIAPTISCPAPVTVQCASEVPAPNTASVTAADNCSYVVSFVSDVISNQTAPNKYTITRTYRAVDPSGNASTCTQTITVNDNTAPTLIVAGSLPGNSNGQCLAGVPAAPTTASIAALYTDNCSGSVTAVLTNTTTTGTNASGWVRKYFYTITDASGNTTTACVTYSGKDTQAPVPDVATLPTITAECNAFVTAPTATDNCAGAITATTTSALSYTAQGTYVITWTYADGNGNTSTQTQTVVVKDVTPPVVSCPGDITITANTTVGGQAGANVTYTASATDNCTTPTITYSKAPGSFFPVGSTTVTVTANDGNGNTSTCSFKVIVNCVTPVFTACPANKTVNTDEGLCSAVVTYASAATATPTAACTYTFSGATTGSGSGNGSGKVFNRGVTTVTITASNLCGAATCSFTVTVVDNEKPRITAPAAWSVNNDAGKCGATIASLGTPVTSDNCGVASVTNDHPSTFYPVGKTIVKWTVTDVNGNVTDTAKTCVTVLDNEMPTISVSNVSVGNSAGVCGANLTLATPVTSDNCGVASVTNDHPSTYYPVGTTTVTWTVTDNAGWSKTVTQKVTVTDTEKPAITCLPNVTLACGLQPTPANAGVATATDNCGVVSVTFTDITNGNIVTRTWTAVDAAGNTNSCTQTITVSLPFTASITSVPTSTTYTGGTANSLFIGYGAQSTVLQTNVPAGNYTFTWSGADAAMLSNTNTANPVFTPTKGGSFTFTVTVKNALGCTNTATITICVTDIRVFATATPPSNNNNCGHQSHYSWSCPHSGHGHSCSHGSHNSYNCPDKEDQDDKQGMCNHQSHNSYDCSHKGHNHTCNHRSHTSYNCSHRSCNDRDDDDDHQKTCDHRSHSSSDCSHRGHNHSNCNHQSHSSYNCPHSGSSSDQKVCNHQSHSSNDCNHGGHNHGNCNHRPHNSSDCPHNGGNGGTDDDDEKKVYICHVPPGNPSQRMTLSIGVSAVAAHLENHPGDKLGSCEQAPCTGYTDNVKPVIDCSNNVTVAYGTSTSPAATGSPEADDNSGDVTITYTDASTKGTDASSASYYNYVITRTWKATDLAGNFATCVQTITVTETTKPVISCPGSTTVACGSTAPAVTGNATATDNSGVVNITYTDAVSGNKTTRTWKATDPSGNYVTCTQTITVVDNVAPVLTEPNDVTVDCGASTAPAATGTATAMDNCSNVTITYTDVKGTNKITRTWKATDASGNSSTDVQIITIVDLVNPTITAPSNITISCNASTTPSSCGGNAVASDNCSAVSISYSDAKTGNVITRTWKATDASGNVATDIQTITIADNTKPVIKVPGSISVNCGSSTTPSGCNSTATATDNCSTPVITYSDDVNGNKITRTWVATDAAGNFSTGIQTITIVDNVRPTISDIADRTVACGATDPSTTGTPVASDACTTPVVTYSDAVSGNRITRTWKATDAAGNYATSTQVITVVDNVKPVITAPSDVTVACSSLATPSNTGTATATDNCSNTTVTYSDATSGSRITRTWKATDASGNYATDVQVITLVDNIKPTITAPADITISCGASSTPSYCGGNASASDNCSAVSVSYSDVTSGNKILRTWKATDASGNFNTDVQRITIVDNTKPVITDVSDITISCGASTTPSGCNSVARATDNCSTPVVTYSDVTNGNRITRTWRAEDAAGNVATSTQIITVVDNTKPVISDVADKVVSCGASTAPAATGTATASDACSTPTVTYADVTSGNVITRTWKATDAAGNTATSVQYITIGSQFTAAITSVPTNNTYTGGVNTNLYLGYGAQSTTLTMCSLPSSGAPYTYAWSGSATNRLSSTTAASPLFTPTTNGYYTFNVTVTNKYGCTSFATISICVTDIRVPGTNGSKVYMCHTPSGRNKASQTIQVAINQVSSHLSTSSCGSDGNDRLGSCDQAPCNNVVSMSNPIVSNKTSATGESSEVVATTEEDLKVTVMPNPSTTFFTLKMESKYETPISMRVMDGNGRVMDAKTKIGSNSTIQIGHNYASGTYYAELIQGTKRKVIQLIKARG